MKNKLIIYSLLFLFAVGCSGDNLSNGGDSTTSSTIETSPPKTTQTTLNNINNSNSNPINDNLIELDAKYRTDGSFVLPTFN